MSEMVRLPFLNFQELRAKGDLTGWEPLCKALGKPVPKGIPFPRINDSEAIERLSKKVIKRGLLRWAVVIATCGLAFIPFIWI